MKDKYKDPTKRTTQDTQRTSNHSSHYKRVIRSNQKYENWRTENDSLSVCTAFAPEIHLSSSECDFNCVCEQSEVRRTKSRIKWSRPVITSSKYHTECAKEKQKSIIKPCKPGKTMIQSDACKVRDTEKECKGRVKFKNECYCYAPFEKPLLPGKPLISVCQNRNHNHDHNLKSQQSPTYKSESPHSLDTLRKAKTLLNYQPKSEFLNRLRKEAKEVYDCHCCHCKLTEMTPNLKYTPTREMLEKCYKEEETERKKYSHTCPKSISPGTKFSMNSNDINCDKINNIQNIRNENYFDTHDTNYLTRRTKEKEHQCFHKFTLDERLLPKPLNSDVYGVSRCTICNKPMARYFSKQSEIDKNSHECTCKVREKSENKAKKKLPPPRIIHIPENDDLIELQIPQEGILPGTKIIRYRRPILPNNSWALRYQKGVIP